MTIQDKNFKPHATFVAGVPADLDLDANVDQQPGLYGRYFKRVLDFAIVVLAAPLIVPVIIILAALVARDGHFPLYRQNRVGKDGRIFSIWKLRTMVPNADVHLADYLSKNPSARQEWDKTQKLKIDPRTTRFGQVLRRTSIDELPQLWNVLIGDMSLVGPRPMMTEQQCLYSGKAYYSLRPGITGFWQISERNGSSFAARASFDTRYFNEMTLSTDIKVLSKTFGVVLRGTGY